MSGAPGSREVSYPYARRYVNGEERYYPLVPVIVRGAKSLEVDALIDSGAVMSLFPMGVACNAGIDLSDARPAELMGVGGSIRAFIKDSASVTLKGLGTISMPVAFTERLTIDTPILGRAWFFESFEITFREWERKIIIRSRQ